MDLVGLELKTTKIYLNKIGSTEDTHSIVLLHCYLKSI